MPTKTYTGSNGVEVWMVEDADIQTFVEVSMGCFRYHMDLETLQSVLTGLSKTWFEIHKDNHANCGCGRGCRCSWCNPKPDESEP